VAPTGVDVAVADQGTLNQLRFALGDDAGQDVSYLSPLGELDDPTLYDWRDDLDRLRAADPAKIVDEAVSAAVPGSHFVVFAKKDTSAIAGLGGDQGNEWQQLFTERTSAVQQAALRDARLTPVGTRELEGWTVTTLERL
jgi:hypothetical protein